MCPARRAHIAGLAGAAGLALLLLQLTARPYLAQTPFSTRRPSAFIDNRDHRLDNERRLEVHDHGIDTQDHRLDLESHRLEVSKENKSEVRVVSSAVPEKSSISELSSQKIVSLPSSPTPSTKKVSGPQTVLLKELYVSGHSSPHPELCSNLGARLRLMILITSAPSHSAARDAIRLTWGHFGARKDVSMAFVIGSAPVQFQAPIERENDLYGDIIVGRFVDAYSNLTLKTISMLEWVDTYCPRVKRILKTDDDMFINIPRLLSFIDASNRRNATKTIWGKVVKKSLPKRTTKSKYYVSPAQYPKKVFPDFATGPAYLMTSDVIRPLLMASGDQPFLRLEDVFVTGILGESLNISRVNVAEFFNKKVSLHPCTIQRGISIHMVRYREQFDLWRKLLDGSSNCPKTK